MKRFVCIFLCLIFITLLCGCGNNITEENGKIKIYASCFPAYDFAKEICKDKADIILLLKPGQEAHDFEPTPTDIINIQKSDLLICVGGEGEKWVDSMLKSSENVNTVKMLTVITGKAKLDHDFDEHVWTSPVNAKIIANEIYNKLAAVSPENSQEFYKNLTEFNAKLDELNLLFSDVAKNAENKTLVFADRFPAKHFTDEYGFNVVSAFPGCNSHSEADALTVANIINTVKQNNIPAVFYTEFSNKKMANTVCEAANCKSLLFHSCHNITKDEKEKGVSYYSLMKENAQNIKLAMGLN